MQFHRIVDGNRAIVEVRTERGDHRFFVDGDPEKELVPCRGLDSQLCELANKGAKKISILRNGRGISQHYVCTRLDTDSNLEQRLRQTRFESLPLKKDSISVNESGRFTVEIDMKQFEVEDAKRRKKEAEIHSIIAVNSKGKSLGEVVRIKDHWVFKSINGAESSSNSLQTATEMMFNSLLS